MVMEYHLPGCRAVILNDIQSVNIERVAERQRHFLRRPRDGCNQMRGRSKNIGVLFLTNHQRMPPTGGINIHKRQCLVILVHFG